MSEDQNNFVRKKKWRKSLIGFVSSVFAIYFALFAVRFFQLNFIGKHKLYTTQIPATLHDGFLDSCWGGHYEQKDWEQMQFVVQFVDLDGDFKTDFILYARDMIMVVEPTENGKWKSVLSAYCSGKFVYLPFTIWGKPKVWYFKAEDHDSGFANWNCNQ